jgi:hypothetical protein
MRKLIFLAVLSAILALAPSCASADPILTLSSPSTGLSSLTVGEALTVDVTLSGLAADDFIFVMNSTVLFPSSLFTIEPSLNNSSGLTPGPILFNPSQMANFNALSSLTAGSATGNFSDSSPAPSVAIGENGVFYSFNLEAAAAGSGSIAFNSGATTYASDNTGFNLEPLSIGSPLSFVISEPGTPVPEPSELGTLGLVGSALVAAGWMQRKRGAAQRSASV